MRRSVSSRPSPRAAFTLVELLVAVAIVAILAVLGSAGLGAALRTAHRVREVNSARTLIAAYLAAAGDNNGILIAGKDLRVTRVTLADGTPFSMAIACQRYPLRLAPYFNWDADHVTMINATVQKQLRAVTPQSMTYYYLQSVFPALGLNYNLVGGSISARGVLSYPGDCVTRLTQAAPILAFVSSGTGTGDSHIDGYDIVTPPQLSGPRWSSAAWTPDIDPGNFGNVCARYDGRAVCAFLDGSVATHTIDELRDMRLWSANARQENNPNYAAGALNTAGQ
jgi:prepilin-type N-terminal cleavage/methylation domain-containing protein